jgi:GT2 family glycosyltransferase
MDDRFLPDLSTSLPPWLKRSAFLAPEYLSLKSQAWLDHIPFAFALTELLQPRSFVELGVYAGDSYCAFCQAMQWLGVTARCHGIDAWQGDPNIGGVADDVYQELRAHHDPKYGSFSTLIRSTFQKAASRFAARSIDLLHIDGCHTYDAARQDWETWRPRLSERGVVLFHDTQVRRQDFGVWRLWEELSAVHPHVEFLHGHGLGVLLVGEEVPPTVRQLADLPAEEMEMMRGMYAALGRGVLREYEARKMRQAQALSVPGSAWDGTAHEAPPRPIPSHDKACQKDKPCAALSTIGEAEPRGSSVPGRAWDGGCPSWLLRPWRALKLAFRLGPRRLLQLRRSGLFDRDHYVSQCPDAASSPLTHYLTQGWRRGLNPHPLFDTAYYLNRSPDVAQAGLNPLLHYLTHGGKETRQPHPCFDPEFYAQQVPDLEGLPPLVHYLKHGYDLDPHPLFDRAFYRRQCPHTRNPLVHYLTEGAAHGFDPHPLFDSSFYRDSNPDVARAGQNPLAHFLTHGWRERRDPSPSFSMDNYAEAYPEAQGTNPLLHHLQAQQLSSFPSSITANVPATAQDLAQAEQMLGKDTFAAVSVQLTIGAVLYRNSPDELRDFLDSILPMEDVRLVLHANSPVDEQSLREIAAVIDMKVSQSGENLGFARAQNRLMAQAFAAGAAYYLAANPDGFFHPECLRHLLRMARQQEGKALIEGMQFPSEHPKQYDPRTLDTGWASGACLLIPRVIWETIGGFDENFFLYGEDVDYSWRARRAGFAVKICPPALFCHDTTDRRPCPERERAMLLAGRYLAWKWGDAAFQQWTERELASKGCGPLPELSTVVPTPERGNESIGDFAHLFLFSPARW